MRVKIKKGWDQAGRLGNTISHQQIVNGMNWTPILWEDAEDPDWHKTDGLEKADQRMEKFYNRFNELSFERELTPNRRTFPRMVIRDGHHYQLIFENDLEVGYQEVIVVPREDYGR